jgi:hypothetical protein
MEVVKQLRLAFNTKDLKNATKLYRELFHRHQLDILSHHDHSMMLGYAAGHPLPWIGLKSAQKFIQNMQSLNIQFDMVNHRSILTLLLRTKQYDEITQYVEQMRYSQHIKPDIMCYNFAMAAHLELNQFQQVLTTWQDCVSAWPDSRYSNQDGWAFVIETRGKMGNMVQVLDLYQHLSKQVEIVVPEVKQAKIRALGYCKRIMDASQIFQEHFQEDSFLYFDAIIESSIASGHRHAILMYWARLLDHCDELNVKNGVTPLCRDNVQFIKERERRFQYAPLPATVTRMMHYYYTEKQFYDGLEIFNLYFPHFEFEKEAFELATEMNYNLDTKDDAQYILYCMTNLEYPAEAGLLEKIKAYRKSKSTRKKTFSFQNNYLSLD